MAEVSGTESGAPGEAGAGAGPSAAVGEEVVLNAAVAFAGQVVGAAQQAAEQAAEAAGAPVQQAVYRQYLLETATLCLRRLGDAYAAAGDDALQSGVADLVQDGAARAREATATVEALGDLSLDILDRLLGAE